MQSGFPQKGKPVVSTEEKKHVPLTPIQSSIPSVLLEEKKRIPLPQAGGNILDDIPGPVYRKSFLKFFTLRETINLSKASKSLYYYHQILFFMQFPPPLVSKYKLRLMTDDIETSRTIPPQPGKTLAEVGVLYVKPEADGLSYFTYGMDQAEKIQKRALLVGAFATVIYDINEEEYKKAILDSIDTSNFQALQKFENRILEIATKRGHTIAPLVNKLLMHVMRGNEYYSEVLLRRNPELLLRKGNTTGIDSLTPKDGSVRSLKKTFKLNYCSPFQYAVAVYDTFMTQMMLKYLPNDKKAEALEQIKEIESNRFWYNFNLITALEENITYRRTNRSKREIENHWQDVVGKAQQEAPVHIIQEICQPLRPFNVSQTFKQPLKRVISYLDPFNEAQPMVNQWPPTDEEWNPITRNSSRWDVAGSYPAQAIPVDVMTLADHRPTPEESILTVASNLEALKKLRSVRIEEHHALVERLQSPEDLPRPPSSCSIL